MKRFVLFGVLFGVCYPAASWLAMRHTSLPAWGLPFEQHVPFVPWMALVYLTIIPALLIAPLILRDELASFATTLCLETLIATAFFVTLPQTTAFHRPPVTGWIAPFFHVADALNLESNQFPSLHVAFACTAAWAYGRRRGRAPHPALRATLSPQAGRGDLAARPFSPRGGEKVPEGRMRGGATLWTLWCLLVTASAWLTWEHHAVDLLGGALLAAACIHREVLWAEACCVIQCARFSMRNVRYLVIFLAIWLPSLLHWRRTRVVRLAFVTAQWIDDLLDGDRPSKRDPLEIVDELLARRFTRAPLPRLMAALFAELDAAAQEQFLELVREMRKDRLRLYQRWSEEQLDDHHRRTFHLSVDLMFTVTGCRARAADVAPMVDALAWCSVFRDLDDDLEKGLINIPAEVTDVEAWTRERHARAQITLSASAKAIDALDDGRARKILGVFQRSIERFAGSKIPLRRLNRGSSKCGATTLS
ncbi:MAG TPA: hypothetical protein VJ276_25825 [Thermoanaerobaculia bacterium]|nr:hypothetical protein [Thermoanaerobaculia bacterium]